MQPTSDHRPGRSPPPLVGGKQRRNPKNPYWPVRGRILFPESVTPPETAIHTNTTIPQEEMGRRKPFIDKKHATTYSLVCEEGPEVQRGGPRDLLDDPAFASACLDTERAVGGGLPENKRKEILDLGLPDDGYDYLQHVRDPATEPLHDDGEGNSVSGEDACCTHCCSGGQPHFVPLC